MGVPERHRAIDLFRIRVGDADHPEVWFGSQGGGEDLLEDALDFGYENAEGGQSALTVDTEVNVGFRKRRYNPSDGLLMTHRGI